MAQKIQTLIFSKTKSLSGINGGRGWSVTAARSWLKRHDFKSEKLDETDESYRFRQLDPETCKADSFQMLTQNFPRGISAVACEVGESSADGSSQGVTEDRARGASTDRTEPPWETASVKFVLDEEADLEEGTFSGLATVFETPVDTFPIRSIFAKGAITKSLEDVSERERVKVLWQHQPWEPIGVPDKIQEEANHLRIVGRISQTARGIDALTLLRDGVVTDLSIGFDPIEHHEEKRNGEAIRVITQARLWEVSLVTWGANPAAKVLDVNKRKTPAPDPEPDPAPDPAPEPTITMARVREYLDAQIEHWRGLAGTIADDSVVALQAARVALVGEALPAATTPPVQEKRFDMSELDSRLAQAQNEVQRRALD